MLIKSNNNQLYPFIRSSTNLITICWVSSNNNYGDNLSNCIKVVVSIPPGNFVLSSNADTPDYDGNFDLVWESADKAQNYSVYQYSRYIFRGICKLYFAIYEK